jgi:hypothetical protein
MGRLLDQEVRSMNGGGIDAGRRMALLALLVVVAVAAACGSGATGAPGGGGGGAGIGGAVPGGAAAATPAAGGEAPAPGAQDRTGGSGQRSNAGGQPQAPRDEARVVKTGTMRLEVSDLSVLARARTTVVGLGGYVSASEQSSGGERKAASVTYRLPAARWDEALDALKAIGKVTEERTQAVEVTGQVLDLGARIENLRASERALQAIMARATRIADVLEVQSRLTDVRGQIEQLSTQKAHLEEQAAYGTLTVTYEVPVAAVKEVSQTWDPRAEVDRAVGQLVGLGQGLLTLTIWLVIVLLPFTLVVGLLVAAGVAVARRLGVLPRRPLERGAPGS